MENITIEKLDSSGGDCFINYTQGYKLNVEFIPISEKKYEKGQIKNGNKILTRNNEIFVKIDYPFLNKGEIVNFKLTSKNGKFSLLDFINSICSIYVSIYKEEDTFMEQHKDINYKQNSEKLPYNLFHEMEYLGIETIFYDTQKKYFILGIGS
jgi:hypothetical protein